MEQLKTVTSGKQHSVFAVIFTYQKNQVMRYMLRTSIATAFITLITVAVSAQTRPTMPAGTPGIPPAGMARPSSDSAAPKPGPKPYRKVITEKAITTKGLLTVHKVEDKYYFEIADS